MTLSFTKAQLWWGVPGRRDEGARGLPLSSAQLRAELEAA